MAVALQWSFSKILHGLGLSRVSKAFDSIRSKLKANEKELRILVTGKAGQGKSALINGLLGAKVAKEGAGASRVTTGVETYTKILSGIPTTVFDSPGLQDRTNNEEEYVKGMSDQCKQLSLVLYCTKMVNTRLTDDDRNAMIKLTRAFGEKFWDYAVFVLTFANLEDIDRKDDRDRDDYPESRPLTPAERQTRFQGRVKLWKHELRNFLIKEVGVSTEIAINIPVVPTGDHKKTRANRNPFHLPDRDNWFGAFWETCCFRIKETSLFLELCSDRIVTIPEETKMKDDKAIVPVEPPSSPLLNETSTIPVGCLFVETVTRKYIKGGYFGVSEIELMNKEFGKDLSTHRPISAQDSFDAELAQTVQKKPSDTITGLSSKRPTQQELMNEVAAIIPDLWQKIAMQLNLPMGTLNSYRMKYHDDPILCFAAVFEAWHDKCEPPYNWTTIIEALESPLVMKIELANVIIKNKFS